MASFFPPLLLFPPLGDREMREAVVPESKARQKDDPPLVS